MYRLRAVNSPSYCRSVQTALLNDRIGAAGINAMNECETRIFNVSDKNIELTDFLFVVEIVCFGGISSSADNYKTLFELSKDRLISLSRSQNSRLEQC
jgi:hypothetical protein